MPFGNLSGPTLLVILFIVLLLFGAPKLPALARSLGQSMKILKKEVSSDKTDGDAADATSTPKSAEAAPAALTPEEELARAKEEAAAAKAEAEALRAAAERRAQEAKGD